MKPYYPLITKDFEYKLCEELLDIDKQMLDKPDLVIYLKNSFEKTIDFIKKGNRKFDTSQDFYERNVIPVQKEHDKMFDSKIYSGNLMIIDRSNFDFENSESFNELVKKIESYLD